MKVHAQKRSFLQKITNVAEPQIGKFYLVPTVVAPTSGMVLPVIGSWHEDSDLGVRRYHFHYDFRFIAPGGRFFSMGVVHTGGILSEDDGKNSEPLVVWRRRKMLRPMPEFPGTRLQNWDAFQAKYKDVKMKCMTCPHRAMPLQGQPIVDGAVVCNGHGLKWNVKTGDLVER